MDATKTNPTAPSGGIQKGRLRTITACLTCRRRKVKCDHAQPVCNPCQRGNRVCTYVNPQVSSQAQPPSTANRVSRSNLRSGQDEIRNRLERLEKLLERAIEGGVNANPPPPSDAQASGPDAAQDGEQKGVASSAMPDRGNETLSSDGYDGALLLEPESGQSRWVSSLHYALLADEIHDVKMLLGDQARSVPEESPSSERDTTPFPFSNTGVDSLMPWLPRSAEDCFEYLEIFFSNVDPMTRLVHKPSLRRRIALYVNQTYATNQDAGEESEEPVPDPSIHSFEPLALAVFYSAVNSLPPETVLARFSADKETLLAQFQRGVELGLGREGFLTTPNIEVLQAFVLILTCQSREDDMSRTWTLLGLAVRMALSQGLHREPSLFPSKNMDVVQVEIRRRLWHQICHLDFRSAEARGQEPTIADEDYTTLLPRNIDDEELVEGAHLTTDTCSPPGFTDMTGHLIRLNGIHCFRRIVRSTYRLERRLKASAVQGNASLYPIAELQALFIEVRNMVGDMASHIEKEYLQFCDANIPMQRLALGLSAVIEWRCWSIFWLRTPKQYREAVVTPDIRQTVLEKSVSLMESMNLIPDDKDAQRFQWHIGGHSCFQAIMHIVSELETPEFQAADHSILRSRALVVLRDTMNMKGREMSSIWNVINRIISNCLAKNSQQTFSLTPYSALFPPNRIIPDFSTTVTMTTPQTFAETPGVQGSSVIGAPLPDLGDLGNLDMQDVSMSFDWVGDPTII
ncbi:hypothetical protein N8T08_010934 [Aspergillus melleus]|uniref:Uncharacterized protein n=1 Tax=Aspergillus melleus TaxID=138277 RepID=A0ACC3AQK0_9EURO|nr:hypothetical protein N8T08_010934 [Aspergillus melleus]